MSSLLVKIVIVAVIVLLIVFDVVLAVDKTKNNTISTILRDWFVSYVWLYYFAAFALGVLMGHWGPV